MRFLWIRNVFIRHCYKPFPTSFVFLQTKSEVELELQISGQQEAIEAFIQSLPHASQEDKAWNLQDAQKRLAQGESIEDLKQKYEFYDGIAIIRDQMLANIPSDKRRPVLQQIQEIIEVRTNGMGREMKREKVESIKQAVELFLQEQTLRRHRVWRTQHLPPLGVQVYKALLAKDADRFKYEYEDVFTKDFWSGIYGIFSKDFPNVVKAFPYPTENDFLAAFTSLDELKKFLENLKSSAASDVKDNLSEYFSEEESKKLLGQLNAGSLNKPADLVKFLHQLHDKKVKNRDEAKRDFENLRKINASGDFEAAHSELESLEKKFGKGVMKALGQQRFRYSLMVDYAREQRLKKEAEKAKGSQKLKLEKKLEAQKNTEASKEAKEKLTKSEREEKTKVLNTEIDECLGKNDFIGARAAARRLQRVDNDAAVQAIKRINEEAQKDSKEREQPKESVDTSAEKQIKVEFLERCIEHMKKVIDQCNVLGVPKDDPAFWGMDGVKNRVAWLQKNGLYETYKKFNDSDPHVPSTAQAGGFRFRWLDLKTGSNLTAGSAESGIKFLKRFDDSGYQLGALAGAFSMNWKGGSDPVYAPEKYMRMIQEELNNVKGGK